MKPIIGLALSLFVVNSYAADSINVNTSTTPAANSRYEIISSTLTLKHAYKLDRYCGFIQQLGRKENGDSVWQSTKVADLPKCIVDNKPKYQIFSSGIAVRHTYLINTDTGKTWLVMIFKNSNGVDEFGWFPID